MQRRIPHRKRKYGKAKFSGFAAEGQIGGCITNRRGELCSPALFDIILRNGQDRSLRVVGAIHESPACHSEPLGEESRFVYFYFALLEILRFAQDDKSGFVGIILCGRAGACSRRFRPLREGAVKCVAFDWGRDFFISLPPSFACGKSHLPLRGRGYGAPSRRPLRSHFSLPVPLPPTNPHLSF